MAWVGGLSGKSTRIRRTWRPKRTVPIRCALSRSPPAYGSGVRAKYARRIDINITIVRPPTRRIRNLPQSARQPNLARHGAPVAIEARPLLLRRHGLQQRLGGLGIGPLGDLLPDAFLELLRRELTRELALLAQPLTHQLEVRSRIADVPEVREAQAVGLPVEDPLDRVLPELEVDVRGWGRRHDEIARRYSHRRRVADEGAAARRMEVTHVV